MKYVGKRNCALNILSMHFTYIVQVHSLKIGVTFYNDISWYGSVSFVDEARECQLFFTCLKMEF